MKTLTLLKSLYNKSALLYTINLYLEDSEYTIDEDEKNYIVSLEKLDDLQFQHVKQELTFNSLRFEIAEKNKDIRKAIIAKALGSVNL